MHQSIHQIPLFQKLHNSQNILLAGAGGGFDIYSGIPLLTNLLEQGKNVVVGNLSFTWLDQTSSEKVFPFCYQVCETDVDHSNRNYFPEKYLSQWLKLAGFDVDIYAFDRISAKPLTDAYKFLVEKHKIDTVLLVDGGTDSLMFGDEDGLGTPQEDMSSMAAAYQCGVKNRLLASVGFGVDHFHGVSHYRFLENVAKLSREGGYLGLFQLTREMKEAQHYIDALQFANDRMPGMESIVSNSIISAVEGEYGDYHKTKRTAGSELWINPLMSIYWCFDLPKVIHNLKYYDYIKDVHTMGDFNRKLSEYRDGLDKFREKKQMPI